MRGCFFVARQIFESPIWRDNPHHLKLFLYLVGMARHDKKPKRFNHFTVNRGELVTSLSDISEDNEFLDRNRPKQWSRAKVSRMLKYLESQGYILLLADTYGTHVKVCNYDRFQDLSGYKPNTHETQVNASETQVRTYNNDNNDNNVLKDSCVTLGEPDEARGEVMLIPLNVVGTFFSVLEKDIEQWQETYQGIKVLQELKALRQWNIDNPTKKKTATGIRRHINSWLSRAQNNSGWNNSGNNQNGKKNRTEKGSGYIEPSQRTDEDWLR